MNRVLTYLDRLQRRHSWVALPVAVFKRFSEHGGGRLATTVSYWSFFSIFPLLLAFVTLLDVVLQDNPQRRRELVDGALGQVPVIGSQLADSQAALGGSWITVAIGVGVALWTGLAAANTLQTAFHEIWDVPAYERPNVVLQRLRSIGFLVIFAVGISLSTLALASPQLADSGALTSAAGIVVSFFVDAALLLTTFWLFVPGPKRVRALFPGALVGAAGIVLLQTLGTYIVTRNVAGASDTYGTFAVVIALLSWFFLVSRVVLLSAELDAVLRQQLWPRSLVDSSPITDGDRRAVLLDSRRIQRDRRIGVAVSFAGEDAVGTDDEPPVVITNPSPSTR